MVRTLFASTNQGCTIFQPYNGVQCTAIALVALLMFMRHSPNVFEKSQSELNCSILHSTDLYRHIISNSHVNGYLAHRDLPTDLSDWNGLNGHITYFYAGVAQHEFDQLNFNTAFQEAVQVSSYHLITFGDSSVAVYYHYDTGSVYLFDSHQRNEYGLPDPFGMAVSLSFSSIDEFLTYIYTAYS